MPRSRAAGMQLSAALAEIEVQRSYFHLQALVA
jgi:hypothetical protein